MSDQTTMRLRLVGDNLQGRRAWGQVPDSTPLTRHEFQRFFKIADAEPSGSSSFGQLFFTMANGTKYTVCPGTNNTYSWNKTKKCVESYKITSVIGGVITVYKHPQRTSTVLVSADYVASVTREYVGKTDGRNDNHIHIFHAGFPEVAPIIINIHEFMKIANVSITYHDSMYAINTTIALTDDDVQQFVKLISSWKSINSGFSFGNDVTDTGIVTHNISPAVLRMMEEFGITYNAITRIHG